MWISVLRMIFDQIAIIQLCFSKATECGVRGFGCASELTSAVCSCRVVPVQDVFSDSDRSLPAGLLQQDLRRRHRQLRGLCRTRSAAAHALLHLREQRERFCSMVLMCLSCAALLSSFARVHLPMCALQGEQFDLSPATPLVSQATVLGDRRTFSVYDLTQQTTFGAARSLNLLIRWKSTEGE